MDNKKQHIDTEFIDHSWHNMSELLDKEMPVQKRKKRFIWLWFLGLSATISLAIFDGYNLVSNQNIEQKNVTKNLEIIAQIETPSTNKQLIEKENISLPNNAKNKQVAKKIVKKTKSQKKNKVESSKTLFAKTTIPEINNKPQIIEQSNLNIPSKKIEKVVENQIGNLETTALSTNNQKLLISDFSSLPTLNIPLLKKEQLIEIFPITTPLNEKTAKWRFGLYASTLTNNLGSFRAGFHSNLALNSKWTLHIELGYAVRNKNNRNDNLAPLTNDDTTFGIPEEEMNPPIGGTTLSPDPDPNQDNSGTGAADLEVDDLFDGNIDYTKFQYFELPILFQYQFRPKWTLDFGGQIAFTHIYQYQQAGRAISTSKYNSGANASASSAMVSNAKIIDNMSLTAISGISFQVTPKLSAYSSYHFTNKYFKKLSNNLEDQRSWNKIEVGVRYYFK